MRRSVSPIDWCSGDDWVADGFVNRAALGPVPANGPTDSTVRRKGFGQFFVLRCNRVPGNMAHRFAVHSPESFIHLVNRELSYDEVGFYFR